MDYSKFNELKEKNKHYWGQRICAQIEFAQEIANNDKSVDQDKINAAMLALYGEYEKAGAVTSAAAKKCEKELAFMSEKAKRFEVFLAAHAHIDMNWMWGWDETVSITLSTFRTMLDLMKEYPKFTFSQSQASVYEIVEKYDKEMLAEIRRRVREGRWEVTASAWVEADKNMTNGESKSRHILYTKRYLSKLLGIAPESLMIDFEPDTFGHAQAVPEITAAGGVKYYYHCRGNNNQPALYRWKGKAGNSLLVYREPHWYNWQIECDDFAYVPAFCKEHGLKKALKVYGVGDHGGGATRRDLDKIEDMKTWPVMPVLKYGTFKEFYDYADGAAVNLKELTGEQNYLLTGCYTSQSRIKAANRKCERLMAESEFYQTFAESAAGAAYDRAAAEQGWRNTLFNHFHDILPGSGVTETREYASALAQEASAFAGSCKTKALYKICGNIDTYKLLAAEEGGRYAMSHGAGGGFEAFKGMFTATAGKGEKRLFAVFNNLNEDRDELAEFTLWDYECEERERLKGIVITDGESRETEYELLDKTPQEYWGHKFIRILVRVKVKAYGYSVYMLSLNKNRNIHIMTDMNPRADIPLQYVLENGLVKAVFDSVTGAVSLYDKKNGKELISGAVLRFVLEDTARGMTSWQVGKYSEIQQLRNVRNVSVAKGELRQAYKFTADFGEHNSAVTAVVSLDKDSDALTYEIKCDFREAGVPGKFIPQFQLYAPLAFKADEYLYDTAFGIVRRKEVEDDQPGLSFICAKNGGGGVMAVTDGKYGYRGIRNSLTVDLIRGSYDPDPTPEYGMHVMNVILAPANCDKDSCLLNKSLLLNNPLSVINIRPSAGKLPLAASFLRVGGDVFVSAVKKHEDKDEIIIRLAETEGKPQNAAITLAQDIKSAYLTDINEKLDSGALAVTGKTVKLSLRPYQIATVALKL